MNARADQSLDEDHELARRIESGDPSAEELLATRYRAGLLALARAMVGPDDASDVLHDALAAALPALRRGAWRGQGPLGGYLATILRRIAARSRSTRRRWDGAGGLDLLPSRADGPLVLTEREEARRRIGDALAALPATHRDVVHRHYFEDLSAEQISVDLGIPRGTVLSRLHHARRKIALFLNRRNVHGHNPDGGGWTE